MDAFDLYQQIARGVPLFPLPNLALLPGLEAPLRIFEPRYAAMTRDALAGNHLIAMAILKPGFEADYFETPAIYPIVCVGEISASHEKDEGFYHITIRGLARATVVREEKHAEGYRLGRLTLIVEQIEAADIDLTYRIACDVAELLQRTAPYPSRAPAKPDKEERSIISFSYAVINTLRVGMEKRRELRDSTSPRERLYKEAVMLSQLDRLLRNGSRGRSPFHGFSLS